MAGLREGQLVADLSVVGGYAQYAIRPARCLVPVPDGVDPAEAVCIPLGLSNRLPDAHPLPPAVARAPRSSRSGPRARSARPCSIWRGILDSTPSVPALPRTWPWSKALVPRQSTIAGLAVSVEAVRKFTAAQANAHKGRAGVDAAFDAIGGAHFARSFACLASGGLLVGYGSQAMADGREGLLSAGLGLARLHLWGAFRFLFGGRTAAAYSITARRTKQPEEFKADMATLFGLLRDGAIHPIVIDRLPLAAAREVHTRIDAGGLGGKIVFGFPGPRRYLILALPPRGSVTHPSRRDKVSGSWSFSFD